MRTLLTAILLILQVIQGTSETKTRTASANADGIEKTVTASIENGGKTSITCILKNHSNHILASAYPNSRSMCFQFTLNGADGNIVPMTESWAMTYAQPFSIRPDNTSWLAEHVRPQEERKFRFFLEDAYGKRASEGTVLKVTWLSVYSSPGTFVHVDEKANADGTVTPAYQEENHFPGRREFVVTLPLTDDAPATQPETPATTPDNGEAIPDAQPARRSQAQDNGRSLSSEAFDLRWLLLLLLPGIAWMLRSIRWRGKF